jgi:hypothetical protein
LFENIVENWCGSKFIPIKFNYRDQQIGFTQLGRRKLTYICNLLLSGIKEYAFLHSK